MKAGGEEEDLINQQMTTLSVKQPRSAKYRHWILLGNNIKIFFVNVRRRGGEVQKRPQCELKEGSHSVLYLSFINTVSQIHWSLFSVQFIISCVDYSVLKVHCTIGCLVLTTTP